MPRDRPKVSFITVDEEYSGQRLDNFLLRELKGVPRSLVYKIVRSGEVRVNDGRAKVHNRLHPGDRIRLPPIRTSAPKTAPPAARAPKLSTLFEDEYLLIVDKPAGLAVHAGSGIPHGLIESLRATRSDERFLELAHRLDRDTSGCLLIAKRRSALKKLHEDLRQNSSKNHRIHKRYQALVYGRQDLGKQVVEIALHKNVQRSGERMVVASDDGMYAKTEFRGIETFDRCSLVEANLLTGRTHQVRVHAAESGFPVLGDRKYGNKDSIEYSVSIGLHRLFLHASYLSFQHPVSARRVTIRSPLPEDLAQTLSRVGPSIKAVQDDA